MSDNPVIALIGPGAIGTTIAAVLHDVGRTPLLCGRTAHAELRLRHARRARARCVPSGYD